MKTISDYEPEFTPVALDRVRHDGWTPERQRLFLVALAAMGTVDSAAQAVGMSRISAYNLKKRADAG
jgi:molybdenum-dependent DNA-binding transcriptional regulator ModE